VRSRARSVPISDDLKNVSPVFRELCSARANWGDKLLEDRFQTSFFLSIAKPTSPILRLKLGKPILIGVEGVEIDVPTGMLTVSGRVEDARVRDAVAGAGFTPVTTTPSS